MGIVGFNYQQERSFDVMQTAAGNEGTAGGVMGAGLGMGMGMGMGLPLGQAYGGIAQNIQAPSVAPAGYTPPASMPAFSMGEAAVQTPLQSPAPVAATSSHSLPPAERLQMLRELAELRTQGILTDQEFESEKRRILS